MTMITFPQYIKTEQQLEEILSTPSPGLIEDIKKIDGDIMLLGAGGKIGPSQAKLAARAIAAAGVKKKVIAVNRSFRDPEVRKELEALDIQTIICDLSDPEALKTLPDVKNILFLAGMKFGSTGNESMLFALNVFMPGLVASRFRESNIVEVSSGNIYGLNPIVYGGGVESQTLNPLGDYAVSVLGRERIFEHFSHTYKTPGLCACLFYAIDLRYGIIMDVAEKIMQGTPIDITMGNFNCIWQGDANDQILRCLNLCESPPRRLNITGPEIVSLRWLTTRLGQLLEKEAVLEGEEASEVILGNSSDASRLFGYPRITLDQMVIWVADWVKSGGSSLGKPSKFQIRDGKF